VTYKDQCNAFFQVEDVMGQRGLIRNIAGRFAGRSDADDSLPGVARGGRSGASPRPGPVPDMVVIERADGPAVLENEPAPLRPDVVRSDAGDYVDGPKVEPGTTRNLVACWKNKEIENSSPQVKLMIDMLIGFLFLGPCVNSFLPAHGT
jgi:hypothetical protein